MQINILIVDDVKANLISLEALLETIANNYNIIKANNGSEALEYALSNQIDLMILDIQMPDMDGFEVAKFLKSNKKTKDIPIIFLTAAFKSQEWSEKGFEVGAIDYLTKPIDENQFINRISLYTKLINTVFENRDKDKILAEQSKMAAMGEMIGNIAHQWRQPLSVISTGATGMLMQKEYDTLTDEVFKQTCILIDTNAQYLSKTIDDFRNFIIGDQHNISFSLKDKCDSFLHLVEPSIKASHINLIMDVEENVTIDGHPNELIQCVINIVNNAKDALNDSKEDNRYVFLNAKVEKNNVIIQIKDNAGGIDESILPKIFEPYFTTKHKSQGTGLGLHMTYNLITSSMHGTIKVENSTFQYNNQEFKGALFTIVIPLKDTI